MVESGDEKNMTVPPGDEEVDQEEVAAELESELAAGDSLDDGDGGAQGPVVVHVERNRKMSAPCAL